jgi:hypothetical protein
MHAMPFPHLVAPICACACCVSTLRCSTYAHMQKTLVITEHNFFANHARFSNKTCPFSSMTSCMNVFTHHADHTFFARISSCHATISLFMVLKAGPTILPSASFTLEKASMTWKRSFLTVSSCSMWQNALSMMKQTVHRCVKRIPPCNEQGMQLATRGFRETVNRITVELVQTQAQIVQDSRGSTFHAVVDTQSFRDPC